MIFNGLEIDMLSLGNADSILVTRWQPGVAPVRILVDGGNDGSAETVLAFLARRGVSHIDHLVCSHLHDDHAAGLVSIAGQRWLTIGSAWVHQPRLHIDLARLAAVGSRATVSRTAADINECLETTDRLVATLGARGVAAYEPFSGMSIGPLFVAGPTRDYYRQLLCEFTDIDARSVLDARIAETGLSLFAELLYSDTSSTLDDSPETSPENNTSVILYGNNGGTRFLFTADAGVGALTRVVAAYQAGSFSNLEWFQLPHHGSRRNVNQFLVDHFCPKLAYVSADGSLKHPRRAVVNAFKAKGTHVFSTHYPQATNLWYHSGVVPARPDYGLATSLWNAQQAA